MKKRIKVDGAIASFVIIMTAFVSHFHQWNETNRYLDNLLDFLGLMLILNGTYIRMAARGHKKASSALGKELVMTGPYSFVRNPMYLGTFLIGSGFILILWPWWTWPIFVGLFYLRFHRQMIQEEEHLKKLFGAEYQAYLEKVPRFFPTFDKLRRVKVYETFPWKEAWTTKETALWGWAGVAFGLETMKENFIMGYSDFSETVFIFVLAVAVFFIGLMWEYSRR